MSSVLKSKKKKKKSIELEPDELAFQQNDIAFEQILENKQWVDDATGLFPHCLAILKICHSLTKRFTDFAMRPMTMNYSSELLVSAAKKIPLHVDDVGMYFNIKFVKSRNNKKTIGFSSKHVSTVRFEIT